MQNLNIKASLYKKEESSNRVMSKMCISILRSIRDQQEVIQRYVTDFYDDPTLTSILMKLKGM